MKLSTLLSADPEVAEALKSAGIHDSSELLNSAKVLEDPSELAALVGIDDEVFSRLSCRAELLSIEGMGHVYADLLAAAGIHSKSQLGRCDPFELHAQIKQVSAHSSVGRIPNRATVEHWIEQAR